MTVETKTVVLVFPAGAGDVADEVTWRTVAARIQDVGAGGSCMLGLATSAAVLEVATILQMSRESLMRLLEINVVGTALAMKAILPLMIARGGGSIVVVASVNATIAEQLLAGVNGGSKPGRRGGVKAGHWIVT